MGQRSPYRPSPSLFNRSNQSQGIPFHILSVAFSSNILFQERRPITAGDWQVDDVALQVDEERSLVYFIGTKDTPLEAHLYVASFAPGSDPHKVHR